VSPPGGRPLRALLVEDSEDDAALVVRQLERGGFAVVTRRVESADEMEAALAEQWDVVLSDFSMPSFTGLEAFRMLRHHDPHVPFILISGTVGEDVAVSAMKAGIQDYLMKDSLERLVPAVERELVEAEGRRAGLRAARALRESEERYRTLIETSPDAILLLDENLTTRMANRRAADLFGGDAEGRSLLELVPPEEREGLAARLAAVTPASRPDVIELALAPRAGPRFAAELSVSRADAGSAHGVVVVVRDVTERQRAEQRLRQVAEQLDREQRFLRALLDTLVEGIVACDAEGRLTLFNRATREFHGIPAEPISHEEWAERYDLYRADGKTRMTPDEVPLFRAFRGELVEDREMVIKPKGGPARTLLASGRPIIDAAGQKLGAVVAMHDVTERRRLEDQFRQSQKMEALGSLAGGVAHDFNNLLTTILGYTELSMMRYEDPALREDLGEIKKAGERASALTQKLLAFSRKQIVEAKVLDLNAVIADLDRILRRLLGPGVLLESRLDPRIGHVKADAGQLEQVLLNLLLNARDALPEGGEIVVETGEALVGEAEAREHVGARPGPHVFLSVTDQGVGIPSELLPRIFEPFFTTKEEGKGTGLGLATVFGIVTQSGGHIRVASEPGRGTQMAIYLPRVDEAATRWSSHTMARVPGGSETILLVEDQEAVRSLAHRVLEATGYVVFDAENGETALAIAEQRPHIDLLLTDAVMPGLSGPKLAALLKKQSPSLKVILMSGYADSSLVSAGDLEGSAFLQKPFSPRDLAERVRRVLDEK
jgi:two-component system cell cycle sensor histidine kinase/response regulator CckA